MKIKYEDILVWKFCFPGSLTLLSDWRPWLVTLETIFKPRFSNSFGINLQTVQIFLISHQTWALSL